MVTPVNIKVGQGTNKGSMKTRNNKLTIHTEENKEQINLADLQLVLVQELDQQLQAFNQQVEIQALLILDQEPL